MLTETFIASTCRDDKSLSNTALPKDAGIFLHDFQPVATLKGHFNKTTTEANCLTVSNTHVFAAQSDGAIVKVFSREKGNLETFVPFHDRITSLALIEPTDGAAILALGTGQGKTGGDGDNGGRVMLWELCTGRLVQTPSSHIQGVTCLAVDSTGNFLLSGSLDSQIHVWSIPGLLSFVDLSSSEQHLRTSPQRTLTSHDGGITALAMGHSRMPIDIAVSAGTDARCNVWDYRTGSLLHTYLMGSTPLCLALDPADRGFYAGLTTGQVQLVDFYRSQAGGINPGEHPLFDQGQQRTSVPTEPSTLDLWSVGGRPSAPGEVTAIGVSYDGQTVISAHKSGSVFSWDVGSPRNPTVVVDLVRPVTNLIILPPDGFPAQISTASRLNRSGTKLSTVVKPRLEYNASSGKSGESGLHVPDGYNFSTCFEHALPLGRFSNKDGRDTLMARFDHFTTPGNPDLPGDMWEAALASLQTRSNPKNGHEAGLENEGTEDRTGNAQEMERLRAQLNIAQKQNKAMVAKLVDAQAKIKELRNQ